MVHDHQRGVVGDVDRHVYGGARFLVPHAKPISRATFDSVFYGFLGAYKIVFLVFNGVPYVALLIVA